MISPTGEEAFIIIEEEVASIEEEEEEVEAVHSLAMLATLCGNKQLGVLVQMDP